MMKDILISSDRIFNYMDINIYTRSNNFFPSVLSVTALLLFLLMTLFACAGNAYKVSKETISITASGAEQTASKPQKIIDDPELFDLGVEPYVPLMRTPDEKQQAYINYMLSSINISNGDYTAAIENLKKVMAYDTGSGYLKKRMALLLNEIRDPETALKYAQESLQINPDDIETKMLLADLYSMNGSNDLAVSQYKEILAKESENQRVRMVYATVLARIGALDEAMEQLNILTDREPDMFFAHYYKGRIFQTMKNYDMAEKEYLLALDINDSIEPAIFDLAGLYYMQGKLEKAAETYQNLLKKNPMNRQVRERLIGIYELLGKKDAIALMMDEIKQHSVPGDQSRQAVGLYYLQSGNIEESIKELDLIVSTWPEDQRSRYYLAIAYEQNHQPEEALYNFHMIEQGNELYINSRIHIAYLLHQMGKTDESIDTIRKGIEYKRDEIDLYSLLASVYESEENYIKAREAINEGLEIDSNNIELIYRLGALLEREGKKEDAIAQMKKVLDLDPNHADALNYIGYTYAENGEHLDEALGLIQKAIKIKPDNGYYIDSLGWVYFQQGKYDNALASLEKAFSLVAGGDPTIAEHLGDVYLKLNRYEKSIEMYEKAISLDHQDSDKILKKIEDVKKLLE